MKRFPTRSKAVVMLALLGAMSTPLMAVADAAVKVSVSDAYVRAVPLGQPNSAAFMRLRNADTTDHAVLAAESSTAKVVELHTHLNEDGVMKMRQIDRIEVPSEGETALRPGGFHVMLMGLNEDLEPGDNIAVTLVFEDGSKKVVSAPVRKLKMRMDSSMKTGKPMKHQSNP